MKKTLMFSIAIMVLTIVYAINTADVPLSLSKSVPYLEMEWGKEKAIVSVVILYVGAGFGFWAWVPYLIKKTIPTLGKLTDDSELLLCH